MKNRYDQARPKKIMSVFNEKQEEQDMKDIFSSVWENLPTDITPQERILFLELIGKTMKSYALLTQHVKLSSFRN